VADGTFLPKLRKICYLGFGRTENDHIPMIETDSKKAYIGHVGNLEKQFGVDDALRQAIGGDFVAVGKLEYHLLRSLGLTDGHLVVDVGCGSGRLACQLAPFTEIRYVGCDVVPRLLEYARALCKRPDWTFAATDGVRIPVSDGVADFAVFFSVFTHLLHEDTYRYFLEAARVLKSGGCLIMSFIEFKVAMNWSIFIANVEKSKPGQHLDQFIDRDGIHAWAEHAGFDVESIRAGDTFHIPIPEEIVFENGNRQGNLGTFGQSVAVLRKKG
jgi:SAM-dependent methyltransferase